MDKTKKEIEKKIEEVLRIIDKDNEEGSLNDDIVNLIKQLKTELEKKAKEIALMKNHFAIMSKAYSEIRVKYKMEKQYDELDEIVLKTLQDYNKLQSDLNKKKMELTDLQIKYNGTAANEKTFNNWYRRLQKENKELKKLGKMRCDSFGDFGKYDNCEENVENRIVTYRDINCKVCKTISNSKEG